MRLISNRWIARRVLQSFLTIVTATLLTVPASAEEASVPSVTIVQGGADNLFDEIGFLMGLTNKVEQQQLDIVKSYMSVFLDGIDTTLPIRIDLIFGGPATRYVSSFPIKKFNDFRNINLKGLTITTKKRGGLYELSNTFNGWMRYAAPYATIVEQKGDLPEGDPRDGIKDLIDKNYSLVAEGRNKSATEADQAKRRESFQNTRKELLGALKRKKDESEANFDLKKRMFELQLDEAERFFVESGRLMLGWKTDAEKQEGRLDIELAPIPGTSLETVIGNLGTTPSYFANIERSANPILSGRLNHPLDEVRRKALLEISGLLRARADEAADASKELSTDEKEATKKIAEHVFGMLDAGTEAGLMDGFIEVHAVSAGKNTLVSGFRTADGTGVVEILKLLPKSRKGRDAKLDVDQEGDVKIHEVVLAESDHPHYQEFFGGSSLYVGSSKDAVWCAAGNNALADLKAAIKKQAEEGDAPANPNFAELYVKLQPWLQLREARGAKLGNPELRKIAIDAFSDGGDIVRLQLGQKDKSVVGQLVVEIGILRFAGKAIADFSRQNLDDSKPTKVNASSAP